MSIDLDSKSNFDSVIDQIENAPQNRKTEALVNGIAKQMQQSGLQQVQQWGATLQQASPQLVKACQQGG